eukprot:GHVT01077942.1.p1 GENE.GHVT01077942.1~~GHVT01077942.1.p1  ORF type:complete len:128 (-),score=23.10 GHVT01077942.1:1512-1895(-)
MPRRKKNNGNQTNKQRSRLTEKNDLRSMLLPPRPAPCLAWLFYSFRFHSASSISCMEDARSLARIIAVVRMDGDVFLLTGWRRSQLLVERAARATLEKSIRQHVRQPAWTNPSDAYLPVEKKKPNSN